MLIRISEGVNWFAIVGQKYIIRLAVKEIEGSTISWARRLLGGSQAVMDATESSIIGGIGNSSSKHDMGNRLGQL
jgi:hypothetical protein